MSKLLKIICSIFAIAIIVSASLFQASAVTGSKLFSSNNIVRVGLFYIILFPIFVILKKLFSITRKYIKGVGGVGEEVSGNSKSFESDNGADVKSSEP